MHNGLLANRKQRAKVSSEQFFWISLSDLMTACMVLFLGAMASAFINLSTILEEMETKDEIQKQSEQLAYRKKITDWMSKLEHEMTKHPNVIIDKERHAINFGSRATFLLTRSDLQKEQEESIRSVTETLLDLINEPTGQEIIKRVVVEGYTDKAGTYLSNVYLSLRRSERVLCALLATEGNTLLSDDQKVSVREFFSVGGYSFNNEKNTDNDSRRVEMRLEFLSKDETRPSTTSNPQEINFGKCLL